MTAADFTVEILKKPPGVAFGSEDIIDVTNRTSIEDIGAINRAVDRDLLSFKTGDCACGFWNADGFMTDMFALFGPTDRWQLRIGRRGVTQFTGIILGAGSIKFDQGNKTCEVIAYGLTRALVDSSGEVVARGPITTLAKAGAAADKTITVVSVSGFNVGDTIWVYDTLNAASSDIITAITRPDKLTTQFGLSWNEMAGAIVSRVVSYPLTVTTATSGATTLTIPNTIGLLTGDVLHVTDQVNKEDVVIKQVTSGTVVSLNAALISTYASGSSVILSTPFYRYKTIDYLVRQLFQAAGVPVAEVRLNNSQFKKLAPTPTNLSGLDLAVGGGTWQWGEACERNSRIYVTLVNASPGGPGTYYQTIGSPDAAWVLEDATVRSWIDWSRFFSQGTAAPATILRHFADEISSSQYEPFNSAFDWLSTPYRAWSLFGTTTSTTLIQKWTSNDGIVWFTAGLAAPLNVSLMRTNSNRGIEKDGARDGAYVCWHGWNASPAELPRFQYWDLAAAFTDLTTIYADDAGKEYCAPRYIPDLDYTLVLRGVNNATGAGPAFQIAAWRGATRLWVRQFPNCRINADGAGEVYIYPTHSARYINGSIYMLVYSDGAVQLLRTDDEFLTYTMRKVADPTNRNRMFGSRIGSQYAFFCYGTSPTKFWEIASPFYAGVINYADFTGKSCADALKMLGALTNSLFWVDDDGQGHFVARDLYDAGSVMAIDDSLRRDMMRSDDIVWEETAPYVEVSGGGVTAVSGLKDFVASGVAIDSPLVPNEAFAQSLADNYFDFYGRRRAFIETTVHDNDGHIYLPLDRVTLDGARYFVYESDHDLASDEVEIKLLEDVA